MVNFETPCDVMLPQAAPVSPASNRLLPRLRLEYSGLRRTQSLVTTLLFKRDADCTPLERLGQWENGLL